MQFDPTLYVITDSTYHTTETLLRAVDEACKGGATLIQLREKDTGGRSYLELAQQVKSITDRYSVPLIIYPTTTHVTTKVTPVSVLNDVCRAVPIPVVAIGGLNADNMDVLADSPIKGIAVVSAVMKADDPCAAAAHIKEKFLEMMNK